MVMVTATEMVTTIGMVKAMATTTATAMATTAMAR